MRDFYFEGQWRMDWGFGNPNITGAFIAMLMVSAFLLMFWGRWGFCAALITNAALGVCLVHTFSRGSLVALLVGLIPVLVVTRPWKRSRIVATTVLAAGLGSYAWHLGATKRYAKGIVEEDRSISNRLLIYQVVPRMIWDAPGGWGLGRASEAYRQWYQPVGRMEKYKHLVSSHATWFVEFGWAGRLAYIAAWSAVVLLLLPTSTHRWLAVPLGGWLCFGTAGTFSDIAYEKWLWIPPATLLIAGFAYRIWLKVWPKPLHSMGVIVGCVAAAIMVITVLANSIDHNTKIRLQNGLVHLGPRKKQAHLFIALPDQKVLGEFYGHRVRETMHQYDSRLDAAAEIIVSWHKDSAFALKPRIAILAGEAASDATQEQLTALNGCQQIVMFNPADPGSACIAELLNIKAVDVAFGEFYTGTSRYAWQAIAVEHPQMTVSFLPMSATFLSDWSSHPSIQPELSTSAKQE